MTGARLHQTRDAKPEPELGLISSQESVVAWPPGVIVPSPGYRLWREKLPGATFGHVTLVDAHLSYNIEVTFNEGLVTDMMGGKCLVLNTEDVGR